MEQVLQILSTLGVDSTVFIQVLNFLLLLFAMHMVLYRPIRRVLAQRKEEVNSLETVINDYRNRSEAHEQGIEDRRVQASKEGIEQKELLKGQALEEEKDILGEAASLADERIGTAMGDLESKLKAVRKSLEDQMADFSNELAEKILGRSIS